MQSIMVDSPALLEVLPVAVRLRLPEAALVPAAVPVYCNVMNSTDVRSRVVSQYDSPVGLAVVSESSRRSAGISHKSKGVPKD